MTESFRTVLGIPLRSAGTRFRDTPGGWVVMPEPRRPHRVTCRSPMKGTVPQVYAEVQAEQRKAAEPRGWKKLFGRKRR